MGSIVKDMVDISLPDQHLFTSTKLETCLPLCFVRYTLRFKICKDNFFELVYNNLTIKEA